MDEFADLVNGLPGRFRIMDHRRQLFGSDALEPFAWEEVLCRLMGDGLLEPLVHIWRHQDALILGLRDRRLPAAEQAIERFRERGERVAVRHSGGGAVPLDAGVVNVTIMLPNPIGRMEHRTDFERMYRLLGGFLKEAYGLHIRKGKVAGSYCPGDYDLSATGRKFCGMSQRRQTRAFFVQAYIAVEGTGEERAGRAKAYYDIAAGRGAAEQADYPQINPSVMASLAEVTGMNITADEFVKRLIGYLQGLGGEEADIRELVPSVTEFQSAVADMTAQLRDRYDKGR